MGRRVGRVESGLQDKLESTNSGRLTISANDSPTDNSSASASSQRLGIFTLSALVIANMIGAGVFTSSGFSLAALEHPGRVMLAWWLCGLWAICGAVAYGGLVSRLPESGGEYLFLSRFVHPAVGFLAGWISVIAGFTAPIAAAALGAALYGLPIFVGETPPDDPRLTHFAGAVIVIATLCHWMGLSLGTGVQNIIVAAKLVLIAVLILWAFSFTESADWQGMPASPTGAGLTSASGTQSWLPSGLAGWTVLVGSMSWVALSYTGFNAAIYVAGESKSAKRLVPRSMLLATLVVTVIYLLLNYVFVYAPEPDLIKGQGDVATVAAKAIGGSSLEWLVRVTILLSMISSVFAMLFAGPRVYQKMSEDRVLPKFFRGQQGSPKAAIVVQAALSLVALYSANLLELMKYLGLTLSACGALAVISIFWVRRRLPDSPPLRWWEIACLSVYLAITALILAASWNEHPSEFNAMVLTFVVGAAVYAIWKVLDKQSTPKTTICALLALGIASTASGKASIAQEIDPKSPAASPSTNSAPTATSASTTWATLRLRITEYPKSGRLPQGDKDNDNKTEHLITPSSKTSDPAAANLDERKSSSPSPIRSRPNHGEPSVGLSHCALIWDARRNRKLPRHPESSRTPESKEVTIKVTSEHQFEPQLLLARPGQTIVVEASPRTYAPLIEFVQNPLVSAAVSTRQDRFAFPITRAEPAVAIPIRCLIHREAKAWVIIQDHDYVGISDKRGEVVISNLPTGQNVFRVWHESIGENVSFHLEGKKLASTHRRIVLNLKPGPNDLGTLLVKHDMDTSVEKVKSDFGSSDL